MIDLLKSATLGIIEGLTEFIPVSSTAHLLISSHLMNFSSIQNNLFEIVIQLGAILAVCLFYRKKLLEILLNFKKESEQRFVLNIFLAFMPAVIIGLAFHELIKKVLFSNLVIALTLIIGGIVMIIVEKRPVKKQEIDNLEKITPRKAVFIGLFQCLAMIPGMSRSGSTIIGGLLLGLNRKTATEFSFFLAIPTIGAATLYDLFKNLSELNLHNIELISVGLLTSFLSALFVIKWLINFVSKHDFVPFAIYRIVIGILILFFIV